jgi:hypothetical protein
MQSQTTNIITSCVFYKKNYELFIVQSESFLETHILFHFEFCDVVPIIHKYI